MKRLWIWNITEPARGILFWIAFCTFVLEALTWQVGAIFPVLICAWVMWTTWNSNLKGMCHSSFVLFMLYVWSGILRLIFYPYPSHLIWALFFIIAVALGICYVYLSAARRALKKRNDG